MRGELELPGRTCETEAKNPVAGHGRAGMWGGTGFQCYEHLDPAVPEATCNKLQINFKNKSARLCSKLVYTHTHVYFKFFA